MRRFSSYGPVDTDIHYYAPRKELIEKAYIQLTGEYPQKGGHYFTVWAPRQTGKTWLMQQILFRLQDDPRFDVLKINLESLKDQENTAEIIKIIAGEIGGGLNEKINDQNAFKDIDNQYKFQGIFKQGVLSKPLILILDEFDAMDEKAINAIVGAFRNIYIQRLDEKNKTTDQKTYLLHGVALIGVRSVLGVENQKGSPFNVQHSLHIPNLTLEELEGMFQWYEKESGQHVEGAVVRALYNETRGQPGLSCWFGELMCETYNLNQDKPINMAVYEEAHAAASHILPNNNILNIISKARQNPYQEWLLRLFETGDKIEFKFDDEIINFLYMNGIIEEEKSGRTDYYVKFSCPFVQTRLFNYFAHKMFGHPGRLIHPLDDMHDAIDGENLHVPNIIKRYRTYLKDNHESLFKNAPRRKTDKRIMEAVYHFNLYRFLEDLLKKRGVEVIPEFPTGNGKIDLILKYRDRIHALELKSFKDIYDYHKGIEQAAEYGRQLNVKEIALLVFVELGEDEVKDLEKDVMQAGVKVMVLPVPIL